MSKHFKSGAVYSDEVLPDGSILFRELIPKDDERGDVVEDPETGFLLLRGAGKISSEDVAKEMEDIP